jgi:hypothetical protein
MGRADVEDAPLPTVGDMLTHARCLGIVDKGADKGALLSIECTVSDAASGFRYATSIMTLFCRGDGGSGGPPVGECRNRLRFTACSGTATPCTSITRLPSQWASNGPSFTASAPTALRAARSSPRIATTTPRCSNDSMCASQLLSIPAKTSLRACGGTARKFRLSAMSAIEKPSLFGTGCAGYADEA